jgi:hypothetical protein
MHKWLHAGAGYQNVWITQIMRPDMNIDKVAGLFDNQPASCICQRQNPDLGLATVYGIVNAHRGDIRMYSDIGNGATFHVYLPLLEKAQESEPKKEMSPLPTGTEHILLVDDSKIWN